MAIQPTQSTGNPTATASINSNNKEVTKEDFLRLLISQLQNQDPLKPLDNQEFAQQLATFNSLEQLINVNQRLGTLTDAVSKSNQFNAATLLGKQVMAAGNQISIEDGKGAAISYNLEAAAAKVFVGIKNSRGELVRRFELNNQKSGEQKIPWDGLNGSKTPSPGGTYTFEISAIDSMGKAVAATGHMQGIVTGVNLDGAEPILELGSLRLPLSSVVGIR
jgi:flagellar basal-body rod modification protein FlgD